MNKPSAKQLRKWIEKISESDQEAFNSLFRSLYPQLVQFSSRYTQNKAAAADLTQEAFVVLWNKRQELDCELSVKAYLYRIVRNSSLNYIRDHISKTVGLEEVDESYFEVRMNEDEEQSDLEVQLLKNWIEQLPDRRREAFELSRFEGLNHDEIADVMDISPNTVNNHIVSALEYLKDCHSAYQEKTNNKS